MQCQLPPPLSEDQISAAIDGAADSVVQDHVARCVGCAGRVIEAFRFEAALRQRLYRWDCPSPLRIGRYHVGEADADDARLVADHLLRCADCSAEVEDLRALLAATAPAVLPAPVSAPSFGERVGAVLAQLLPRVPMLATRGVASAPLIAEADGLTMLFDFQPAGADRVTIVGQLSALDQDRWTGALVVLRRDEGVCATAVVDDVGGFRIASCLCGRTSVCVTPGKGVSVYVPVIDVSCP